MPDLVTQADIDTLETGVTQALGRVESLLALKVFAEDVPVIGDELAAAFTAGQGLLTTIANLKTSVVSALNAVGDLSTLTAEQIDTAIQQKIDTALTALGPGYAGLVTVQVSAGGDVGLTFDSSRLTTYTFDAGTLGAGLDTVGGFENLTGSAQADNLTGNELANLINGGTGADRLTGGVGRDLLHGGVDTDADIFILRSVSESAPGAQRDLIYDFTSGTDRIDLRAIDPDSALAGNQAFALSTSGAAARSVWIVDIGDHLVVRGDVTGDTTADFELQVMNTASLQAADFML